MNLFYLNHYINALASKREGRTQSAQLRLCELLQDADEAGYKIELDHNTGQYFISGGVSNG